MNNLREAIAAHFANVPRNWSADQIARDFRPWFQGFIAACIVLDEHQRLQTLKPRDLETLARDALKLLNAGLLDYTGGE